ncbi:MAG: GspE/PulE family protein [Planctomycetaceae bacterium]
MAGPIAFADDPEPFPPIPGGEFFRGNAPGDSGYYLDLWLFGAAAVLFVVWLNVVGWANNEGRRIGMRVRAWNALLVAGGLAGFLTVLTIPPAAMGFLLLAALAGGPFALFLLGRNAAVPDRARVLTPRHLKAALVRRLARWGVPVGLFGEEHAALGADVRLVGKTSTGRDDLDRSRQAEYSTGFVAAKELVYDAVLRRATDIHLEPREHELACRIRIDGAMYPVDPLDRGTGDSVVNVFKVLAGMDITEKRRAQDGSFRAEIEGRSIDIRAATQGTRFGEKLSLRLLDPQQSVLRLSELGMRKELVAEVESLLKRNHGMLLCCGPTGAGKSTTLYAALRTLDPHEKNIITVEDPVEFQIPHVNQIEINDKAGQSVAGALRNILRQDPDVLMIGEIRDSETARIACEAANTGHLVLSTVHSTDTFTALHRLIELSGERYVAASALAAIVGQRLVRRLCPACKVGYRPDAETLKKHGLPAEKIGEFFRPPEPPREDCPHCAGMGYFGRVGIFELLAIDGPIREMIHAAAPLSDIRAAARRNGMLFLHEEGLRHVVRGATSLEEMLRVVQ